MTKKMLFLDLDGTLLDDNRQITEGNRRALEDALSRGHGVIITTGRPFQGALNLAREMELDKPGCYTIAFNGALIYDWESRQVIFRQTVPMEEVRKVFAAARELGVHVQTYDDLEVLIEPWCDRVLVEKYCRNLAMNYRVEEDVCAALEKDPYKLLVIEENSQEKTNALVRILETEMADKLDSFHSTPTFLDIVKAGMSKGEAVIRLCDMLNIPICDAIAVGDAANDLSMIVAAGVGVAMANGTEDVKAAADYITQRDNNHDGVAEVVERFMK